MRIYETTFIVNPQTDDATIDRQVQTVVDLITKGGGKILREDRMGTRRMAYPIAGLIQGHYASYIYEAPTTVLPELDRLFKLEEAYIRNLTIIFEGDPTAEPPQRDAFARTEEGDDRGGRDRRGYRDRDDRGGGYRDRDDRGGYRGRDSRDSRDDDDRPRRPGRQHMAGGTSIARQEAGPANETAAPEEAPDAADQTGPRQSEDEL